MINSKYTYNEWIVLILFIVSPFVMSLGDAEIADLLYARTLPSFVPAISGLIRWLSLVTLTIISVMLLSKNRDSIRISPPVIMLSVFYFIQLLYSIVDGVDVLRFFMLTVFSLFVPSAISHAVNNKPSIKKIFVYCILLFLIVSILLNGQMVFMGSRFFGFMNNANAYGLSLVFWIAVLLFVDKEVVIPKGLFAVVLFGIIITLILSGSRNGMVGVFIILIFNYYSRLKKLVSIVFVSIVGLIVISYFLDISFVLDRLMNISHSFEDSGRNVIWERSFFAIKQSLWWGNGMDANYIYADTGNMHNCYLRFILNMGVFFTVLSLSFYFSSIVVTLKRHKTIPTVLAAYLISFAIMNIGEDFFVGLGSSAYIYTLFVFGLIDSYYTNNDTTRQPLY